MDVDTIPQYHKQPNVHDVEFDESNYFQKWSLSEHHEQKKNLGGDGRLNADAVDYYVPNYLQKPSLSDHHKQKENLDDERQREQTRKARSTLLSMSGSSPTDFWDDDLPADKEFLKQEKAWCASNTCTSCGSMNWRCWCKGHYEEKMEALKGPSIPVKTEPKETLLSFLLSRRNKRRSC